MERSKSDYFKLKSGREIYVFGNVIGLSPELEVTGGWDNTVYAEYDEDLFPDEEPDLTRDERLELADYMLGQWHLFKEKAQKEVSS